MSPRTRTALRACLVLAAAATSLEPGVRADGPPEERPPDYRAAVARDFAEKRYDDAELRYFEALRNGDLKDPRRFLTLYDITTAYEGLDRPGDAERVHRKALEIMEGRLGADDAELATWLMNLAGLYARDEDFAEARGLCERSLAILEKAYGAEDPRIVAALEGVARIRCAEGENAAPLKLLSRAAAIIEKAAGPEDPALVGGLVISARIYTRLNDAEGAAKLNARAEAILRRPWPRPKWLVADYAGALAPEQRDRLLRLLEDVRRKTGVEFVVVMVPGLGGKKIEEASLEAFNAWGIGDADRNDGLLLVVAVDDRLNRLTVGKGLTTELTDDECLRLLEDVFRPRARAGSVAEAIYATAWSACERLQINAPRTRP